MSPSQRGPVTEVEFTTRNPAHPFVGLSGEESCSVELAEMVPRSEGYAEFFNVTGAAPAAVSALAADCDAIEVALLAEFDRGGFFEFHISGDCPARRLAELGALPKTVRGIDGQGTFVVEVPPRHDPSVIINAFLDEYPRTELASKREKAAVTPRSALSSVAEVTYERLTDRQREVLRTAFEAGYYDWPRGCTGKEVAEELDIASATFSEHIRAAERKLFAALFDEVRTADDP